MAELFTKFKSGGNTMKKRALSLALAGVMMDRMNKRGNPYLRLYPKAKSIQFFNVSYNVAAAAKSLQSCSTLCDPIDGSHQAPPSLGFSRQEHWSGLPFPSPMHESEK